MSGILGLYHFDDCVADVTLLQRMSQAIAHRGVDGIKFWTHGSVGLGSLKLHTTEESVRETQPLVSRDGTCCLTLDGRIDNRKELSAELTSAGFAPRDDTDAEIVLCAYQCWGEESPGRLLGDFAFAIWDSRKRLLFCARDHVGVRPFYYFRSDSMFAFGSEIHAIITLENVPKRLNESRVVDYLVDELERDDTQSTFYKDILRLPAGHSLTVNRERLVLRDYWQLKSPPTLKLRSLKEYGEAFCEVFVEAVRCRLRSNGPVASTLSGGIDSSSVVCTIRELLASELPQPLHTISLMGADEAQCGETPYIKEVLKGGRVIPHIVRSNEVSRLDEAIIASDEPFEIYTYLPNWFIFDAARRAGTRVLLDGTCGDHITPPCEYLATLVRRMAWKTLARDLSCLSRTYAQSRVRLLFYYGFVPLMPNAYRGMRWVLRGRDCALLPERSLIEPDFAEKMAVRQRIESERRKYWKIARNADSLHAHIFTSGVLPFFFEQCSRIGASMQVEARHPFLDRRVIDFFLSLPLSMKLHSPIPKLVIRTGMKGILPELVRQRTAFAHVGWAFMAEILERYPELHSPGTLEHYLKCVRPYVNVRANSLCIEPAAASLNGQDHK